MISTRPCSLVLLYALCECPSQPYPSGFESFYWLCLSCTDKLRRTGSTGIDHPLETLPASRLYTMLSVRELQPNGASRTFATNPMIENDQSQWIFTSAELVRSPSILDGLPVAQELANRQKGVNFITQVGIMLKLPQLTHATASVYLHRFFMRHGMQQPNKAGLHHYSVAATALFLATKVEENCRKMRELVVACCRVAQKNPNLVVDEQNKEYWKWRDTILHNEDLLLEALCFDLQLDQPYRILFEFLQYYGAEHNKILRNTSWAFLNDSHVTTMCLLHSPRTIAGAALYVGLRLAGVPLSDDEQGRSWWEHLDLDVFEIQRACNLMFEVYQDPALSRRGAQESYQKEDDMTIFERTRSVSSPRPDCSPSASARSTSQGVKRDRSEAEGAQSEEWGGPATAAVPQNSGTAPPSPKRQRRGSNESANAKSQIISKVPPALNGSAVTEIKRDHNDDVQQRIDDIVNASNPTSNQQSPQASLTRRPSSRQQWQDPPPTRRSDSSSNWQRPPSANSNADRPSMDQILDKEDRPGSRQDQSNGRVPLGQGLRQEQGPNGRQEQYNGRRDEVDDADKVDYGSEEGEV